METAELLEDAMRMPDFDINNDEEKDIEVANEAIWTAADINFGKAAFQEPQFLKEMSTY